MNPRPLSSHEADSIEAVVDLHQAHHRATTPLQRGIDGFIDWLGRPHIVAGFVLAVVAWTGGAAVISSGRFDEPSYAWIELCATLAALLIAMLILATQRRQDQLAERRAQLTLQLALLADKKMAKMIALLEEFRRDNPNVADRVDAESEDMAKPANPQEVLAAIDARAKPAA